MMRTHLYVETYDINRLSTHNPSQYLIGLGGLFLGWKWFICVNYFILKCIHNGNPDLKWMGLDSALTCYHNTSNSHQLYKPYSHWEKVKYCYICLFSINKKFGFVCWYAACGMFTFDIHVLYRSALASAHQGQPLPKTLSVMESTPQVRGMHTIIRYDLTAVMNT